jgi:type IV fimbrial biogenesis protein FimT
MVDFTTMRPKGQGCSRKPDVKGMTLVELMTTVSILMILLIIGVPTFSGIIARNRAASHTNEFLSSLYLARSEAITRGQRVVLCKSSDGASCTASGTWGQGWIAFVDVNNDATVTTTDPNEIVLLVHGPLDGGDSLATSSSSTPMHAYISYTPDGRTRYTSGAFQADTLSFSLCAGTQKTNIVISPTGRARVEKVVCP